MKTELKITKLLIEKKEQCTIRDISKHIGADYKITHNAITNLITNNIVKSKIAGNSLLCNLNKTYYGNEIYLAETERKQSLLKNSDLNQLSKEILNKIKSSFFILLIFGSYAKKTQTKQSDIDIAIISNEKKLETQIYDLLKLLPLKTDFLFVTEKEFIRMKDSKESNVIKEIIQNNIIIYGIENYYKLKNA